MSILSIYICLPPIALMPSPYSGFQKTGENWLMRVGELEYLHNSTWSVD